MSLVDDVNDVPDRAGSTLVTGRVMAAIVLVVLVGGALFRTGILDYAQIKDERTFWVASVHFAHNLPPTPHVLRESPELSTPLPFIAFGVLHLLTGLGIVAGRLLNLAIATALLAWILVPRGHELPVRMRAAMGLLAFPYFAFCAVHLYTDMVATLFAVGGVMLHVRGRYVSAAVALILAVASRQTMVAFPAALCAWELLPHRRAAGPTASRIAGPALALVSLGGWIWVYGGLAPPAALAVHVESAANLGAVFPRNALYFLACLGAYHVVLEAACFRGRRRNLPWVAFGSCAVVLLALFAAFPPFGNVHASIASMGALDRVLRGLFPDLARVGVLWVLASMAVTRLVLRGVPLMRTLILANAVAVMLIPFAWDKYALPMMVLAWMRTADEQG